MANVYVEARPRGRPEAPIQDCVVEDHANSVLATFRTQAEAVQWAKLHLVSGPNSISHCPYSALERQTKPRPLARSIRPH